VEAAHPIWRPLGQLLVDKGLLSQEELEAALNEQSSSGRRLGEIIVERKLVSGPALTSALAEQWGIVLTTESGFGTGLRAQIDARHRAARGLEPEPETEITLDVVAEMIDALAESHPEAEEALSEGEEALPVADDAPAADPPVEAEVVHMPAPARVLHLPAPAQLHLLFVPTAKGYRLAEAAGPAPTPGTVTAAGLVTKVGRSPLPGDARVCAYLLPE
jgi:hypothetical protein